jgi:predicted XRE-type DNA-binding protein
MKQKTLEDKKFQQKLVDKLNNGELSYQNAPIYTILLDLVQGNSVDEVYRVFCEVIKEQNKKLYSEEEVKEIIKLSCEKGMLIQRTINDKVKIPYTRIKDFTIKMLKQFKKK